MDVVVGKELCGVTCCMGFGVFVLKYNAIQRLILGRKEKTAKEYICVFSVLTESCFFRKGHFCGLMTCSLNN